MGGAGPPTEGWCSKYRAKGRGGYSSLTALLPIGGDAHSQQGFSAKENSYPKSLYNNNLHQLSNKLSN